LEIGGELIYLDICNSSIDTSLIRDIYCGPEVLFETCVATKFINNDDDNASHICATQETVSGDWW